jgi:hypothetical protein
MRRYDDEAMFRLLARKRVDDMTIARPARECDARSS